MSDEVEGNIIYLGQPRERRKIMDTANSIKDFNETEFKRFGTRVGDKWTFSIPAEELQDMDNLLPDHVLTVKNDITGPASEAMSGKLVRKKEKTQ